ncbi:hypothetical protein FRB99_003540 [Tulasnella sp. 403]|nr:hypothetical protein FRB99_003540 [Tulasnella sp. 403]
MDIPVTIDTMQFDEEGDDDETNDPTYQPGLESEASASDVSMLTSTSALPSDQSMASAQSGSQRTVSTIYPDDSVSVREERGVDVVKRQDAGGIVCVAASETSETPSVLSFHSSGGCHSELGLTTQPPAPPSTAHTADGHLFRTYFGRAFNNKENYWLPADDTEHFRLDMQHNVLKMHLNSLYASPEMVEHALRSGQQPPPAILDVGTGSGRWAIEMAVQFPRAEVIGMDLAPPAHLQEGSIPSNCRFEVDDANLPMDHYASTFNVVHVRSADAGINDFNSFLYEVARTLRPNGVLLLVTGHPQIYGEDLQPFPVTDEGEEGFSWVQHTFALSYVAYKNRGNDAVDCSLYWHGWLEKNPNYRNINTWDTYIPMGPWKPNISEREYLISMLMREDLCHIMHSFKPLLLADGHKPEDVDKWVEMTVWELRQLKIHGNIKWRYTTAIRTEGPWQERLEEPQPVERPTARLIVPKTSKSDSSTSSGTGSSSSFSVKKK